MENKDNKEIVLDFDLASKNETTEIDFMLEKKNKKDFDFNSVFRQRKSHRLQSYITPDLWKEIQKWKKSIGIKKDSDAIEALLVLGLRKK